MTRDLIGSIMAYESGEMTHQEVVKFFQHLIDNGLVSRMQDSYSRIARILIERGECRPLEAA
jgi:hypothetical protein